MNHHGFSTAKRKNTKDGFLSDFRSIVWLEKIALEVYRLCAAAFYSRCTPNLLSFSTYVKCYASVVLTPPMHASSFDPVAARANRGEELPVQYLGLRKLPCAPHTPHPISAPPPVSRPLHSPPPSILYNGTLTIVSIEEATNTETKKPTAGKNVIRMR